MTWALLADGDWGVGACSQAAAHERQVGQTYLRVGNLVEARKHLARAEQLLQIETPNVYDVPTTAAREHAHKSRLHGQGPSPARPPPRHAPGGSGRLRTCSGRARATVAHPTPRVLEHMVPRKLPPKSSTPNRACLTTQALDEAKAMTHDSFA